MWSNSIPGVRMCEELIKTSLSIVEVLSQHHTLTSPHHGVVSIPSNKLFPPSLLPSDYNLSHLSVNVQMSEDLPVTNPLLNQGNLWSARRMFTCVCAHTCLLGRSTVRAFNDYWRMEVGSSRKQTGRKEKTWQIVKRSWAVVCCSWQSIMQEDTLITTSHLRLTFIAAAEGNTVTLK